MLYGPLDPNERFRARRVRTRRQKRRRRAGILALALALVIVVAVGAKRIGAPHRTSGTRAASGSAAVLPVAPVTSRPRPLPVEIRGVHVTGPLASLPGRLQQYLGYTRDGLNTIELDVKDEGGEIGFTPPGLPLASRIGATRAFYAPREVVRLARARGVYLIGRVVVFQDPRLARARPELAIRRRDGSVWTTRGGLAWVNPYDRRVWAYAVAVAAAAARAGFDEIMLDYVRFPSDGDLAGAVYPGRTGEPRGRVIASFVAYAKKRLEPLGARVSVAVFGLSASRDLGIGQVPRWISRYADTIVPMSYPVLYARGELGLAQPRDHPGETVLRTLADFRRQTKGTPAQLVTWVQDWGYRPEQVLAQVEAARLQGTKGFLLWNAEGVYTRAALAAPAGGG